VLEVGEQGCACLEFNGVDLIGAADLGQDRAVRRPGVCVALAVEPLSELWVRRAPAMDPGPTVDLTPDTLVMADGLGI